MKSNPLLSLGTLLISHFSMFFFLSKSGGIFLSIFASTHNPGISHLPHILYPSLQPLPLPDRHSLTSPSLSTLPCCQLCQLPWLKVAFGIRNIFLMIAPHFPVLWDTHSCLGCGSSMATLCFPALTCFSPYRTPPLLSPTRAGLSSREGGQIF